VYTTKVAMTMESVFQENQTTRKWKRHTNTEKLAIARKALLPDSKISSVERGESLPESTVWGWVNNLKKLEEIAIDSN
jgi:transposase-like protein